MTTNRRATIESGLERVWASQGRLFASFEADLGDEEVWVQYLDGELNVRWPSAAHPEHLLARTGVELPKGAFLLSWRPEENAIFAVGALLLPQVAELVASLFERVLEVGDGAFLECEVLDRG